MKYVKGYKFIINAKNQTKYQIYLQLKQLQIKITNIYFCGQMPKRKTTSIGRKKRPDVSLLKQAQSQSEQQQDNKQIKPRKKMLQTLQMKRAHALQLLSGTNNPGKFKFRQKQTKQITQYINECMSGKKKGYKILMITGSPGAGKTLSTSNILLKMKYLVIRLNANIIKSIQDVQSLICSQLLQIDNRGNKFSTIQIMRQLQDKKVKKQCIIYVEQVQILLKQKSNIFTEDFFNLFCNPKINLMLLGISNTIDALQKYGEKIFLSIKEIKNVVFKPYTVDQMKGLLQEKIDLIKKSSGLKIIYPDNIMRFTATRLINLKKGDFRIALQFLKKLAEKILPKSIQEQISVQKQGYQVDASTVNKIFMKLTSGSDKEELIKSLTLNQQITLTALYHYKRRTDEFIMMPKNIISDMKWICQSLKLNYQPKMMSDSFQGLIQYGMISNISKQNQNRIMLKVSPADIQSALSSHIMLKRFFEDQK